MSSQVNTVFFLYSKDVKNTQRNNKHQQFADNKFLRVHLVIKVIKSN